VKRLTKTLRGAAARAANVYNYKAHRRVAGGFGRRFHDWEPLLNFVFYNAFAQKRLQRYNIFLMSNYKCRGTI